jgi:hypothetical protein
MQSGPGGVLLDVWRSRAVYCVISISSKHYTRNSWTNSNTLHTATSSESPTDWLMDHLTRFTVRGAQIWFKLQKLTTTLQAGMIILLDGIIHHRKGVCLTPPSLPRYCQIPSWSSECAILPILWTTVFINTLTRLTSYQIPLTPLFILSKYRPQQFVQTSGPTVHFMHQFANKG